MPRLTTLALAPALIGIVLASAVASAPAVPREGAQAGDDGLLRAVIHINFADVERHKGGLKNVRNILRAVDGRAEIEVVCHSGGIGLVVADRSEYSSEVRELIGRGVRFVACENTMAEKSIAREDLLPGVGTVPSGAVEVIRKQQEGFGYFRP